MYAIVEVSCLSHDLSHLFLSNNDSKVAVAGMFGPNCARFASGLIQSSIESGGAYSVRSFAVTGCLEWILLVVKLHQGWSQATQPYSSDFRSATPATGINSNY